MSDPSSETSESTTTSDSSESTENHSDSVDQDDVADTVENHATEPASNTTANEAPETSKTSESTTTSDSSESTDNNVDQDDVADTVESQAAEPTSDTPENEATETTPAANVDQGGISDTDALENEQNILEGEQGIDQVENYFNDNAQESIEQLEEAINNGDIGGALDAVGEMVQEAGRAAGEFEGLGESLEGTLGKENDYVEAIGGVGGEVVEGIAEIAAQAGEAAGEISGTFIESIGEGIQHIQEGDVGIGIGQISGSLVGSTYEVFEGAVGVGEEVVEAVREIAEEVGEGIYDIAENYFK